jgi:tryptophanyl-tRNA synthetase
MHALSRRCTQCLAASRAIKSTGPKATHCSKRWESSQSAQSFRTTIFSGIQPTGVPHLGNYLGALREWVKLQDTAAKDVKLIFSIVDLHALTVPQERRQLRTWRKEAFATLIAVGLDPNRSTLFYQSSVCLICTWSLVLRYLALG